MAFLTDPANELAQLAKKLSGNSNKVGLMHLSETFGVEPSGTQFFALIHTIVERADVVAQAVIRSEWEVEQKKSALGDIKGFKSAFSVPNLMTQWNSAKDVGPSLMKDHGRVITYMSDMVRKQVSYPVLSDDERQELIRHIDDYLEWLESDDEAEPFVKRAIADGLSRYKFALVHLEWSGAGYSLEAFRQLTFAYAWMRDQQGGRDFNSEEALSGLLSILKAAKEKVDTAKEWADTGGTLYRGYSLATNFIAPLMIAHQASS